MAFCHVPQMTAPEAYIQLTPGLTTDDGTVTDESTEKFLASFMAEFEQLVARVLTVVPRPS